MKISFLLSNTLVLSLSLMYFTACQKNKDEIPLPNSEDPIENIIVKEVFNITNGSAAFRIANYYTNVREVGICWSDKNMEPTYSDYKMSQKTYNKDFEVTVKCFTSLTTYSVRAYVVQGSEIKYSNSLIFTTLEKYKPINNIF